MEMLFVQGKGDDQVQLSVNVSKEEEAMMRSIKEEGSEDWTDRDIDLYKAAKRRLENEVGIVKSKEKLVIEDVQQKKKDKKKKSIGFSGIVLIIIWCIVGGGIIWFLLDGGIIKLALILGVVGHLFGKGK